jgi:hypothetical protein
MKTVVKMTKIWDFYSRSNGAGYEISRISEKKREAFEELYQFLSKSSKID